MSDDKARRELAGLIEDLLSRGKQPDMQLAMLVQGVSMLQSVLSDAQDQHGDWGVLRSRLHEGVRTVDGALAMQPPLDARWVAFATWQRGVASTVLDTIERLQADETTLV